MGSIPSQPVPAPAGPMSPYGERAEWVVRAQGALLDYVAPGLAGGVLMAIMPSLLDFVVWALTFGFILYTSYLGGSTGQSYGKKWAGTKLISDETGELIGGGMGIARYFLHIIDALPCYVGFLWPIWDEKRQTFSDKILNTTVIKL